MFAHRLLTLGHIVATTKIPWKKALGLEKEKKFNADETLAKRGTDIVKRWQTAYQVSLYSILTCQKSVYNLKTIPNPAFCTTLSSILIYHFSL